MSSERSIQSGGLSRRDVLRRGAVATAIAGLGLSGLSGSAVAGGSDSGGVPSDAISIDGPTVITEPGYYVVTKDLVRKTPGTLIRVEPGVNDVTIDGQGHTLRGCGKDEYPPCYGVVAGEYADDNTFNTTIKNLVVTNFWSGIALGDNRGSKIHDVKVTHCQWGIEWINALNLTISDSIIAYNDIAIFEDEGASGGTLLRNRITRNGAIGGFDFSSNMRFEDNRFDYNGNPLGLDYTYGSIISGNLFYQNAAGLSIDDSIGSFYEDSDVVRGNRFIENDRYGIQVGDGSRGVLVEKNDVFRNGGDGIRVQFLSGPNTLSKNRIIGNGGDGVHLENADATTIVGNLIRQNTGDGIELRSAEFSDDGSDDNVIRENIVRENGGLPIRIDGDSTGNVVEDNLIDDDAPDVCRLPEE